MTDFIKIVFPAIILLLLGFAGLAISILVRKNGKFPHTHIHGNKNLQDKDIHCIQREDRLEQDKVMNREKYKNLKYMRNGK